MLRASKYFNTNNTGNANNAHNTHDRNIDTFSYSVSRSRPVISKPVVSKPVSKQPFKTTPTNQFHNPFAIANIRKQILDYALTRKYDVAQYTFLNKIMELASQSQTQHTAGTTTNSFLITGAAGTGKSTIMKELIRKLTLKNINFGITATTGAAAVIINGQTLNSFLMIGTGKRPLGFYLKRIRSPAYRAKYLQLRTLKLLIIDEVSMLGRDLFDFINVYLQQVRNDSYLPFGGIKMVFCGDFFQLPPVNSSFCFTSPTWQRSVSVMELTRVYRQSGNTFAAMLSRLRKGKYTEEDVRILYSRLERNLSAEEKNKIINSDIKPTTIFANNKMVDTINQQEQQKLIMANHNSQVYNIHTTIANTHGETIAFTDAHNMSSITPEEQESINSIIEPWNERYNGVRFAIGDQVMVSANISPSLVNGTRGIVTALTPHHTTIRTLEGQLVDINYHQIIIHNSDNTPPPPPSSELNTKRGTENGNPNLTLDLEQERKIHPPNNTSYNIIINFIPLRLAYAITIHKSQGVSLDYAIIDVGNNLFAYGQAYTALSRVRDINNLIIKNINIGKFKTDPLVLAYFSANHTS